ncbi:MAG: hypothetical protein IT370_35415 [Deltaproteobacteria bacterium]|nr:hypothetical protein [Deltaproteobacteria bacterium]
MSSRTRLTGVLIAAALLAGCGRQLPPRAPSAALYRDLERIVTVREAGGWEIDRLEVEGALSDALMSVCQVERTEREALAGWLEDRISAQGGPVEQAYRRRGRKLGKVASLLELTRIRLLLAAAMAAAPADCPFWLEPRQDFAGRQVGDGRWQVSLAGGGKVLLQRRGERDDVTGGGAGRILLGRNFGSRLGLLAGLEGGGSADIPPSQGGVSKGLVLAFDLVAPVVARFHLVNSYFEVEGGYLAHFTEEDRDMESGLHLGVAFGARALRTRWFFPGAAFAATYERTFPEAGEALQLIKLGLRVTLDVDL